MRHIKYTQGGKTYRQISKPTARKLYEAGGVVYLSPSKMNPASVWGAPFETSRERSGLDFETLENLFTASNCSWSTGYRVAFYACEGVSR